MKYLEDLREGIPCKRLFPARAVPGHAVPRSGQQMVAGARERILPGPQHGQQQHRLWESLAFLTTRLRYWGSLDTLSEAKKLAAHCPSLSDNCTQMSCIG